MRFDIISLFPEFVAQCAAFGVVGRAGERGLLSVHGWNPRDYAEGNYRRVDDRPFGGGPGMVMMIEPLRACLADVRAADPTPAHVVYMSPQGAPLTQAKVRELAAHPRLVLLCGRYEGVDERFLQAEVDEEVSIGDYVLSGGELAAAVVLDAVARLQEGALNDAESAVQDSFEDGLLDCPHYTRPVEHALGSVPSVLLSGNHAEIARWRRQQSLGRTWLRRPDLLDESALSKADRKLLEAFRAAQVSAPVSASGETDSVRPVAQTRPASGDAASEVEPGGAPDAGAAAASPFGAPEPPSAG
jgi:tRNA (guanine37-N1)-methyltransferase